MRGLTRGDLDERTPKDGIHFPVRPSKCLIKQKPAWWINVRVLQQLEMKHLLDYGRQAAIHQSSRFAGIGPSDTPMISSAMFPWLHRVLLGVLVLQGLWGTIGEGIALGLPHALAPENMMMEGEHRNHHDHHQTPAPQAGQWEGSPEGIAYSEFNHALAGVGVILVGLSELRTAIGWQALAWVRWLLPASLVGSGIFLLIWSDHEAWPIGSWTLPRRYRATILKCCNTKSSEFWPWASARWNGSFGRENFPPVLASAAAGVCSGRRPHVVHPHAWPPSGR
jgi:hypothetical protein